MTYQQPGPQWQPAPPSYPQSASSGMATMSLVLGILGIPLAFCTFGVLSVAAVITGHMALREAHRQGRNAPSSAVWGMVLGYLMVVPGVAATILVITGS